MESPIVAHSNEIQHVAKTASLMELVALKRSAHHAFIEWMCGWKARPTLFVNNVFPSDPPRFGQLTVYQGEKVGMSDLIRFRADTRTALEQNEHDILINFEGRSAENIRNFNMSAPKYWGAKQIECVLFLRDPLNNFSSLTKRIVKTSFNQHLKVFYQTLRFCEYMDELKGVHSSTPRLFSEVILFTAWQRDESYRQMLAERMELTGADLKSEVPSFGGGSSFSGVKFDPVKQQEKLFLRWREMQNDPFFLSLFLSERVFSAVETYYDMFGDVEREGKAAVHELRMAAQSNPEAVRLCQIWLSRFEKSQAVFDSVEREKIGLPRRLRRAYATSKIKVQRLIYGGF